MANVTCYVNASTHLELKCPRGGRDFLQIENCSGAVLYVREDTPANADDGTPLDDKERMHWSRQIGDAVPQGTVWIVGSAAAPTMQRVLIKEQHIKVPG